MKRILAPILLLTFLFPSLAYGVTMDDLVYRDGRYYVKEPFTGKVTGQSEGLIVGGKQEGLWVYYHDNGQLGSKGTFKNGRAQGLWVYYHDNGKLERKINWKNGLMDGPSFGYHRDGTVDKKFTGTYKNGLKVSD